MPQPDFTSPVSKTSVHVERRGQGPVMVFLHGWGMQRQGFDDLARKLQMQHEVHLLDMPGHGHSTAFGNASDVVAYADFLLRELNIPQSCIVCGWSMGALIAMQMALIAPHRIRKLVLFTATPCFVTRENWNHGIEPTVLQQFATELQTDYARTIQRFLALQCKNSSRATSHLRQMHEYAAATPIPDKTVLQQGLQLLETTDLRPALSSIQQPVLVINGDRDALIPAMAGRTIAEQVRNGSLLLVHGAGHMPFLTHTEQCWPILERFLHE